MRIFGIGLTLALLGTGGAALAQGSEAQFRRDVLQRLERIERSLAEAPPPAVAGQVTAQVSITCRAPGPGCAAEAREYCQNLQFRRGVPVQTGFVGTLLMLQRVTCTD